MEVKGLFDILRKEAECSFCIHTVNKPKTLPCLHSFCLDCLNNYSASRRREGDTTLKCPVCLATLPFPDNDKFDAFPTAFYHNRLLDILALEKGSTHQKGCDNCEEDAHATYYCFECTAYLCRSCLDTHSRLRVARTHRLVSLHNLQTADLEELIQRPVFCEKRYHEREPLEYYCQDCQVCICHKCGLVAHSKHCLRDIPVVAQQYKADIAEVLAKVKTEVLDCEKENEKDEENFKDSLDQIKSSKAKVQATVEELMGVLKAHEETIMKRLDDLHQSQKQDRLAQQEKCKLSLTQMNSCIEDAEAILKRNFNVEIIQSKTVIAHRCENLLRGEKVKAIKRPYISFTENEKACQRMCQLAPGQVFAESYTNPLCSVAEGEGLREAVDIMKTQFTVITKDSEGMPSYSEKDQVTVHIQTASGQHVPTQITDNKDGTYVVTYQPLGFFWPEELHIKAHVNGKGLPGNPWRVKISRNHIRLISIAFAVFCVIFCFILDHKRDFKGN